MRADLPYEPWQRDLHLARFLLYVVPAAALALALLWREHPALLLAAALGSVLIGWHLRQRVAARRFGQALEAKSVFRARGELERAGFTVESGRMTRFGDIDLLVRHGAWCATVEIKSFGFWRARLRDRARQRKARLQARRQRSAVGADMAVIWLPKARTNWLTRLLDWLMPERDPVVLTGSAHRLATALAARRPR